MRLQQGLTYFESLRKQHVQVLGVLYAILSIVFPNLYNLFGNYYPGFTGYIRVNIISACVMTGIILLLFAINNKKILRKIGKRDESQQLLETA